MTKATYFNRFGTNDNRVVAVHQIEADEQVAMDRAARIAAGWNKTEKRSDMIVHFVLVGSNLRALAA
jgi:hypothetical protein